MCGGGGLIREWKREIHSMLSSFTESSKKTLLRPTFAVFASVDINIFWHPLAQQQRQH